MYPKRCTPNVQRSKPGFRPLAPRLNCPWNNQVAAQNKSRFGHVHPIVFIVSFSNADIDERIAPGSFVFTKFPTTDKSTNLPDVFLH
jgi:hypothetical protein